MTDKEVMQMALTALFNSSQPAWGYRRNELHLTPKPHIELYQEAIEALRTALTQPESAECDGGKCGISGYCKECPKPLVKLKEMLEVQGRDGTWNYDPYFHGMYNGMEVMLAVLEGRKPVFRGAPEKWLSKKEWVGLTDEECLQNPYCAGESDAEVIQLARAIEAKLKEKNT